jgi:hypothetical protein
MSLAMDPVSIEIVLKSVEWLAGVSANSRENMVLPAGMKCQRRQENIFVLSLLRSVDRFSREAGHHSGRSRERGRVQSVWEQGGVPRNGDRSGCLLV